MVNVPEFITIGQAIDFHKEFGSLLLDGLTRVEAIADPVLKDLEALSFEIEQAYWMASFFSDMSVPDLQDSMPVLEALFIYRNQLAPLFITEADAFDTVEWGEQTWCLPTAELKAESTMLFGEFIDSKVMIQSVIEDDGTKWEMLLYVATIFFRLQNEEYQAFFLFDGSDRIELIKTLPLQIAAGVGAWFEEFTAYLQDYFPVFAESQLKGGSHMKIHMEQWGWTNFLKSIAATKIFDVANSGLNSIDCARRAKAYDVLVAASEEKQYNEAQALDMEAAYKSH